MTSQDRDSVGDSLERDEAAIERLKNLIHTRRYDQVQGGFLVAELGKVTLDVLQKQHEALILIERNLDDRLQQIQRRLDEKP